MHLVSSVEYFLLRVCSILRKVQAISEKKVIKIYDNLVTLIQQCMNTVDDYPQTVTVAVDADRVIFFTYSGFVRDLLKLGRAHSLHTVIHTILYG